MDDGTVCYLEKISDDQTIPEPSAEPTTEPSAAAGLRPEFKEAMDSYEAFYTEYCDLLKKYMSNPSDLSILSKYMSLMGKLSDMDEKFEAWESEDLNSEELKYYITSFSGQILLYCLQLYFRTVRMVSPARQEGRRALCLVLHDPPLKCFLIHTGLCRRSAYAYLSR